MGAGEGLFLEHRSQKRARRRAGEREQAARGQQKTKRQYAGRAVYGRDQEGAAGLNSLFRRRWSLEVGWLKKKAHAETTKKMLDAGGINVFWGGGSEALSV